MFFVLSEDLILRWELSILESTSLLGAVPSSDVGSPILE